MLNHGEKGLGIEDRGSGHSGFFEIIYYQPNQSINIF
jgi:hypothetical protein